MTDSVGDTMYGFTSLYAERAAFLHPTAEQRQKYGFNDPYTVAKVTLAVESTSENKNSSTGETESTPIVYNNTTYTITVGCIDTDGNYVVMVDGACNLHCHAKLAEGAGGAAKRQHHQQPAVPQGYNHCGAGRLFAERGKAHLYPNPQ